MPEALTQVDQEDSIEKLSGRELDIAVAERVMRWPRRDYDDDRDYAETYFSAYNDGGQIVVFRDGSIRTAERWSPAQSKDAAIEVVEKMGEQHWCVDMMNQLSKGPEWLVVFETADKTGIREASAADDSLPTAICLAALNALEATK